MFKLKQLVAALFAAVFSLSSPFSPVPAQDAPAAPKTDAVVGAPCHEAEFDAALAAVQASSGGTITFQCGGPATITFSLIKHINKNVVIDGGTLGVAPQNAGDKSDGLIDTP